MAESRNTKALKSTDLSALTQDLIRMRYQNIDTKNALKNKAITTVVPSAILSSVFIFTLLVGMNPLLSSLR
ncbi:hypothetical protein GCM10009124_23660 [Shewanella xiamenensis]|jgi:hypothetical protein|nr:hypothetical protein GCM10009124_23660 [Shewanella xiamenensis]